jgi:hypothetical protein
VSFIRTGLREIGLKLRRQKTRLALRHEKRLLQRSEINLGREGTAQAANFPELRNEIVALKKLEQEQKEVAFRIAQIEDGIKKIEGERAQNLRQQNEAIGKLETEKKPVLQRRNEAKASADICDRELGAVDRRIHDNDEADRELLKQIGALETTVPPPPDRDIKAAALGARRARLPDERAELVRARLGSAAACQSAKEKLKAADAELGAIEKTIERVRSEFEAKDRTLAEAMRTQQEAIKEARAHHQVVEERKNPAYLNIGRHLASQDIAPPNAPHLLADVHRRRGAVDRHLEHTQQLALLSSKIDKQELRKFYFSVISILGLLAIILPLVLSSPRRREWLPQESEAILSLNIEQFDRNDLPRRWRKEQPDVWAAVWAGLVGGAAHTPALNLNRDATRVTRAIEDTEEAKRREFILVQTKADVTPVIRAISQDKNVERRIVGGLAVWQVPGLAVARVGPNTLAIGSATDVDTLVEVRLGMQRDLKITGSPFEHFQTFDRDHALRLMSRDPPDLSRAFHPIFTRELLESAQLLGLVLGLDNPIRARLLIKTASSDRAQQLTGAIHDDPNHWLHLADSDLPLFAENPSLSRQDTTIELNFTVPDNSARLLLQRLAKTDTATVVASQPTSQAQ